MKMIMLAVIFMTKLEHLGDGTQESIFIARISSYWDATTILWKILDKVISHNSM